MSKKSNKIPLGIIFRQKREEKGLLIRQVAAVTELDQAIVSRIENGDRLPTKEQLLKLAGLYNMDIKEAMSAWLAEKMVRDYGDEPYLKEALLDAHDIVQLNLESDPGRLFDRIYHYIDPGESPAQTKNNIRKPGRKGKNPGK